MPIPYLVSPRPGRRRPIAGSDTPCGETGAKPPAAEGGVDFYFQSPISCCFFSTSRQSIPLQIYIRLSGVICSIFFCSSVLFFQRACMIFTFRNRSKPSHNTAKYLQTKWIKINLPNGPSFWTSGILFAISSPRQSYSQRDNNRPRADEGDA